MINFKVFIMCAVELVFYNIRNEHPSLIRFKNEEKHHFMGR